MIFFSNDSLYLTPNYYVQQLFAVNAGNRYLETALGYVESTEETGLSGGIGLGSWMTSVAYDDLKVVDEEGNVLFADDFSDAGGFAKKYNAHTGSWKVENGRLIQSNTGAPVDGNTIRCYIDGKLYVDYTQPTYTPLHASTVMTENGDVIVKLVNAGDTPIPVEMKLPGLTEACGDTAQVTVLKGASGSAVNSFDAPNSIAPENSTLSVSDEFVYTAEGWSVTVIRIPAK